MEWRQLKASITFIFCVLLQVHFWDRGQSRPFPGLYCEYCKLCKKHILVKYPHQRGRWFGRGHPLSHRLDLSNYKK